MQKIQKSINKILSANYRNWLLDLRANGEVRDGTYRYYYNDIIMALFRCQKGVCAYTEMYICIAELYQKSNWQSGKYIVPDGGEFQKNDHLGELEHFDADNKKVEYWNWENLFMVHSKINGIKSNNPAPPFLKPDIYNYKPEKYFEYDFVTNRFIPNTQIKDSFIVDQIQYAIDKVFCLNHGVVRNERKDYLNLILRKKNNGEKYKIDRFYTSVKWMLLSQE